jgi:hypothetical protein
MAGIPGSMFSGPVEPEADEKSAVLVTAAAPGAKRGALAGLVAYRIVGVAPLARAKEDNLSGSDRLNCAVSGCFTGFDALPKASSSSLSACLTVDRSTALLRADSSVLRAGERKSPSLRSASPSVDVAGETGT